MKNIKMNKKAYRIVAAMVMTLVIGVYFVTSNLTAYASNIIITGDAAGSFSVTSTDKMLFDLKGLYPGDTDTSSVTISNTDMENDGFEVFMYAENTSEAEYDLGRVTRLTVTDGDKTIYDDMLIDFDEEINSVTPISLGRIAQGASKNLDFAIEIDGEKADNNYQVQQSLFVVTFVATSYGAPVVPPGPGPTPDPTPSGPSGGGGEGGGADMGGNATTASTPTRSETFTTPDNDVPLGSVEVAEQDVPRDFVESEEEKVPLGAVKEMPKTGERSLALYIVPGVIIICCGLFIIMGKGKKKMN